jgi:hypothetical protein
MIQEANPLLGVNYCHIVYNCEFIINFLQGTHKNPFFGGFTPLTGANGVLMCRSIKSCHNVLRLCIVCMFWYTDLSYSAHALGTSC